MLPRFLRSALDSTPLSLYHSISRSVSFSLPISLPPSTNLVSSLPLSPFLYLALSFPLSIFRYPSHLSCLCFTPSLSLSLSLYSCLRRSHNSATELAIPQIVTASYRTIDSSVPIFRKSRKLPRGARNDRHEFALRFDLLVQKFVYLFTRNVELLLTARGFTAKHFTNLHPSLKFYIEKMKKGKDKRS